MNRRTINCLFLLTITISTLNQVICQWSGDGIEFEDDDDFSLASGSDPIRPAVGTRVPPSILKPDRGQGSRGSLSTTRRPEDDFEEGSGDDWFEDDEKFNPPHSNSTSSDNRPIRPPHDDEDNLPEASGYIPLDGEIKEEVPKSGVEVIVDPPTPRPSTFRPRLTTSDDGFSLVDRSTSAPPYSGRVPSSTTQDIIIRPDDSYWSTSPEPQPPSSFHLAFFKLFTDPLILAGIIGGAVLALLFIVLIVMFMVYRMRKKDEGSYALGGGEPKKSHDIRYTRTSNQEYFA